MKTFKHLPTGTTCTFADNDVVLTPDWQEVTKDYEVLACSPTKDGEFNIESVKRLSDGEVFSVGDENASGRITKFIELSSNKIIVKIGEYSIDLKYMAKFRTPIRTSNDGVELFEGDKHWWINTEHSEMPIRGANKTGEIDRYADDDVLYFSTREAAEDYRLNNARVLSLNDFKELIKMPYCGTDKAKDLVKSRT